MFILDLILLNRIGIVLNFFAGFMLAPELIGLERLRRAENAIERQVRIFRFTLYKLQKRVQFRPSSVSFSVFKIFIGLVIIFIIGWALYELNYSILFVGLLGLYVLLFNVNFFISTFGERVSDAFKETSKNNFIEIFELLSTSLFHYKKQQEQARLNKGFSYNPIPEIPDYYAYGMIVLIFIYENFIKNPISIWRALKKHQLKIITTPFKWLPNSLFTALKFIWKTGVYILTRLVIIPVLVIILYPPRKIFGYLVKKMEGDDTLRSILVSLGVVFFIIGNIIQLVATF